MKHAIEHIPIYHGLIGLCITSDPKDLYKVFTKDSLDNTKIMGKDDLYAHALWISRRGKACYTIVLNFESLSGKITHGAITHEALHIMSMVFHNRDVVYTYDEDEVAAYFIEWITGFVYKHLKKWGLTDQISINH